MQLEQNPTLNQTELEAKRKQLKELQEQEKELTRSLPINIQIANLQREIKELESKTRTPAEETLLTEKKKQLSELLDRKNISNINSNKPSNKTALYIGCGVIGLFALLLVFVLAKNRQKGKVKK